MSLQQLQGTNPNKSMNRNGCLSQKFRDNYYLGFNISESEDLMLNRKASNYLHNWNSSFFFFFFFFFLLNFPELHNLIGCKVRSDCTDLIIGEISFAFSL